MVIVEGMKSVIQVQILDKADYVSLYANALERIMNPYIILLRGKGNTA